MSPNRAERRAQAKAAGVKPTPRPQWTREQTERFLAEAFTNRISWVAARILLERVTNDLAWGQLDGALRLAIVRFLESHPKPEASE